MAIKSETREAYVDLLVAGMDEDTLVAYVTEHLNDYVDSLSDAEFRDWVFRLFGTEVDDDVE